MVAYLVVNFGGPRTLSEVEPFLCSLLTDRDVVHTKLPQLYHNFLFNRIAKKRTKKIVEDYTAIGGGSLIFSDTEYVAAEMSKRLDAPVFTFHRYLPMTHKASLEKIEHFAGKEIRVLPMFPQFTYATTGSIARFFQSHLSNQTLQKLRWVKSYPSHPAFISLIQRMIREYVEAKKLDDKDTILLFSAHGLPKVFVEQGDLYAYECELSFSKVLEGFPTMVGKLSYQSKFGPGEWLRPYTEDVCQEIETWSEGRKTLIFVPISFTSDHIETLFEMEQLYFPIITNKGLHPHRLPAPNRRLDWLDALVDIVSDFNPVSTSMLIKT